MEECLPRGAAAVGGSIIKEWPMRVVLAKPARLPLKCSDQPVKQSHNRPANRVAHNPRHIPKDLPDARQSPSRRAKPRAPCLRRSDRPPLAPPIPSDGSPIHEPSASQTASLAEWRVVDAKAHFGCSVRPPRL